MAEAFDVPRTTMYRAVSKMLTGIVKIVNYEIYTPQPDDLDDINDGFVDLGNSSIFGICGGALSTKYVIGTQEHAKYIIRLQILTDHIGNILDLFVSSSHIDPFEQSTLFKKAKYPPTGYYIVATNEYPGMTAKIPVVTPYVEPENDIEITFNKYLRKAHKISEDTVAMLESRWPKIFQIEQLVLQAEKGIQVIACCAVVHNICLKSGDMTFVSTKRSPIGRELKVVEDREGGMELRDYLSQKLNTELITKGLKE